MIQMCDTCVEKREVWQNPKSLGKIINKIDNLELKMQKLTTSEDRGWELPYKPSGSPPRCRGG